jgi:hypothetical protein
MSSGGQFGMAKKGFTGLVGKAAKLGSKVTGIGKPKNDSFNPFKLLSSKDVNKLVKSVPTQKEVTPTTTSKASTKPTILQIILLLIFSFILGTLMFYLNNKGSGSSGIKNGIMVVCIMIAAIGITGFLNLNINIYDLLISSQINILCLFFFLSYIGVTTISSWDLMIDIGTFSRKVLGLITNPTELFNKGFDLIVPTIFMLIPFIILVTNFLKMSGINFIGAVVGAILTALISIVVVYFLWPDNLTTPPIEKNTSSSSGVADKISGWLKKLW